MGSVLYIGWIEASTWINREGEILKVKNGTTHQKNAQGNYAITSKKKPNLKLVAISTSLFK